MNPEMDKIILGDCRDIMKTHPDNFFHSVVCDPPYELTSGNSKKGFMGKAWDGSGIAYDGGMWQEVLRVLKPGGHMLAFGGTRTYHRMACAIEDAGFECRDMLEWVYGSGFPKSLNISKQLSQEDAKKWEGFGTSLKPAHEPIGLFRKPLACKTIAENVLEWGCGGLNIDSCRIGTGEDKGVWPITNRSNERDAMAGPMNAKETDLTTGRFPSNLIWSHSPLCTDAACHPSCPSWEFAKAGTSTTGNRSKRSQEAIVKGTNWLSNNHKSKEYPGESGSPARFFKSCQFTEEDIPAFIYQAKASRAEKERGLDGMPEMVRNITEGHGRGAMNTSKGDGTGIRENKPCHNQHPTVKPLELMKYLVRLATPPNGIILDPFAGSGTTLLAAKQEGFRFIGIEKDAEYHKIACKRIAAIPRKLTDF